MDGDVRINPYLSGNFAPIRSEDDFDLVVRGEIPKEPPPKPERTAATIRSYILHTPPPPKAPPKGIGSMDPPGG